VKRILVAVDGSQSSYDALCLAAKDVAECGNATLEVLIVSLPVLQAQHLDFEGESVGLELPNVKKEIRETLGQYGLKAKIRDIYGLDPGELICLVASQEGFDELVIGKQGRSAERVGGSYLGSVAYRILHLSPCPVIVV
jgi:nucleotide-binding universal stress UspA family protein